MISFFLRLLVLSAIILACPAVARANIGEDLSQLRARYGSAKQFAGQMLFNVRIVDGRVTSLPPSLDQHEGYSVAVYFDGSHSAMEVFTRNTADIEKAEISQEDINHILDSEGEGKAWNPGQARNGKSVWIRADNKLIARFNPNTSGKIDDASVLVIMLNAK